MTQSGRKFSAVIITVLSLLFVIGCSTQDKSKIPITTSSRTALKHFLEGRDLSERFRVAEATAHFELALEADSSMAMAYFYDALTQQSTRNFMSLFSRALQLADSVSDGERLMIRALEANVNADPILAHQFMDTLLELYPRDERALSLVGGSYYGQQEYQKAIDLYLQAIEINPAFSQPYNMLGYAYRQLKDYKNSEKYFLDYIKLIPDDPNPYDSYAELLLEKGEFDNSIEYYKKALAVNPEFFASHIGVASNLMLKNEHARARRQLQKGIDIVDNYASKRGLYYGRAVTYVDEGRFTDALAEIDNALALSRDDNDTGDMANDITSKGDIMLESEDIKSARDLYRLSMNLVDSTSLSEQIKENTYYNLLYRLARCDLGENDLASAKEKAGRIKEWADKHNNPAQIRLYHQLQGTIVFYEKDYDMALIELQQANQLSPYNLFRIAQTLEDAGDLEQAAVYYERAANFNSVLSLNYAYIRKQARAAADSLRSI